jgi:periplasmic copper chaperone A
LKRQVMSRLGMAALAVALAACLTLPTEKPLVTEARVGAPAGPNAALYFTAEGRGTPDLLLSVISDVAEQVEIHESAISDDGTVTMTMVPSVPLAADGVLVFEPGGLHVMLIEVEPLEVGSTIEVSLFWETAGEMTVQATVVELFETMGDEGR